MRHLQFDLKRGDGIFGVDGYPLRVVTRDGFGARVRPEFAVGEREIGNSQTRMLMPHGCGDDQLAEN